MDAMTKQMLREAGFETGTVGELLGLSEAQEAIVEIKVRLTELLRDERKSRGWSQARLASELETRQQVIARAEMGHRSVTLDLLLRALLTLGVSLSRIVQELEACETFLAEQADAGVGDLVEIAPIEGLVRPASVAGCSTITDRPLLRKVLNQFERFEHLEYDEKRHVTQHGAALESMESDEPALDGLAA
jgi:transcriptional regulator with XRE-family HTH domain